MSELPIGLSQNRKYNALHAERQTSTGQPWDEPEDDKFAVHSGSTKPGKTPAVTAES